MALVLAARLGRSHVVRTVRLLPRQPALLGVPWARHHRKTPRRRSTLHPVRRFRRVLPVPADAFPRTATRGLAARLSAAFTRQPRLASLDGAPSRHPRWRWGVAWVPSYPFAVAEPPVEIVSEHDHGPWHVRIRQVKQGHRWVITEIHVTPGADVPTGGLTARDFDLIRPVSLAWVARRGAGPPLRGTRPQEPKWADEELEFLQRYAALVAKGERAPAKALSEEYAITERAVHNRLSRLRNKGMLTRPGPGAAGGEITANGKAAIRTRGVTIQDQE
jgi:hypothetical protein